ncbi:hypothetical protein DY000_02033854 [Brassica cretica]|uniref:F-box domain-containing protein n=1 Tax=Brassica cretica TaxID=69181 RepID=A0ABQ7DE32_BRACR|nr:hypothetical protein DY000_02033854 [Brassica cretica]
MKYFPILKMPEEIQVLVVECVAGNSFQDLYGLRASCKLMKAFADRRSVCHFYDVLSVPWGLNIPADLKEEGISLMKRAADAGYERTVYTHAITREIFWCDGQYFAGIPRETVDRIGKLVRSVKWGWGLWHSDEFRQNRVMFTSAYLLSFYSCQCANLVERQCLCLWHIDVTKDNNMCDRCFWIKEIGMFLRGFGPISLFRDTRKW